MKLYATTKGKATKGQGSNTDILIVLTAEIDGQRVEIASMDCAYSIQGNYHWGIKTPEGKQLEGIIKGKSQKGEN